MPSYFSCIVTDSLYIGTEMNILQVLIQGVMTRRNLCKHLPAHYLASHSLQWYCITLMHACTLLLDLHSCTSVLIVGGIDMAFVLRESHAFYVLHVQRQIFKPSNHCFRIALQHQLVLQVQFAFSHISKWHLITREQVMKKYYLRLFQATAWAALNCVNLHY